MAATDFCSGYWHWLLFAGLLAVAVLRRVISFEAGRMMMDRLKLRVPLMKRFVLAADVARFARTLALLLEAGVAIEKALELSAETMRNRLLRNEIRYARRSAVQQGMPLSEGLRQSRCFPPFVANMTAVGEEAGQLETSLNEVALFYEKEVDQQSRVVTSLIEPALILLVGGVVGFIVAAMLLPIFRMGGGIR
jgi:type II secretory pathway component PulF